ncbi:asparagine synthase (glutamine-hydrolyzing) [Kitasatospora sp. NPDC036755]|uniref:asparagine synthase (glutamine-hydrolyzing) n=1 Tax=Kitasatospora sp. NPDC036755 TaxID=3154600 RepID=UPI0033D64DAA
MCGIAGFLANPPWSGATTEVITSMLSAIRHRGPDQAGYYLDDGLAMGAVRLAIVDPADGAQPMSDPTERHWICFNGEIYNHVELRAELEALGRPFRTDHSDTEVALQAWIQWGPDCFARFNGPFALAIRDTVTGRFVLARDRYGKRPLYYAEHDGALLFASEAKAFGAFPGFRFELSPKDLAAIYAVWTPLPDRTPFVGVRQLPTGSFLEIDGDRRSLRAYEELSFDVPGFDGTEREAVEFVRESLRAAVELRLRSDVEVGVYLSGGLDSSVVTALATRLSGHRVRTFSVAFRDKHFDESDSQLLVADHLGTLHSALPVTRADIADNLPAAVYHAEVPAFRTSFVPMFLLSRHVRDAGVKTVLSGEGSDEAFLGYSLFRETMLRERWHELTDDARRAGLATLHPELEHFGPAHQSHLLGLYQQFATERLPGLFSHELRYQNGRFAARLIASRDDPFADLLDLVARTPGYQAMSAVQKAQWLEYKTLLPGFLLSTQGERVALAHSVENRCPFLDPAVVRAASSVNLRFDDGWNEKAVLKKAFRAELPAWTTGRPKQPYRAPGSEAFTERRPDYLELLLSDAELGKLDFLDQRFARRLTDRIMESPAEEVSTKEDQAFVYLLTTAVLHRQFVLDGAGRAGTTRTEALDLKVTVDRRHAVRTGKEAR